VFFFNQRFMAEAELDISTLTVPELLATTAGMASALEGNANFPTPKPTPEELRQLAAKLTTAEELYREQRKLAHREQAVRDSIAETLRQALAQEVTYVQVASGGRCRGAFGQRGRSTGRDRSCLGPGPRGQRLRG
jgi:hypothetical protein